MFLIEKLTSKDYTTERRSAVNSRVFRSLRALFITRNNILGHFVITSKMPDISGYETTKIFRAMENIDHRHTPIIATTAFALLGDREKCIEAGMDDYLAKPIDAEKFYTMVQNYVSEK